MNLRYDIDFKFTETTIESVLYTFEAISKLIDYRYRNRGEFQYKSNSHTDKANFYGKFFNTGITGYYSL